MNNAACKTSLSVTKRSIDTNIAEKYSALIVAPKMY